MFIDAAPGPSSPGPVSRPFGGSTFNAIPSGGFGHVLTGGFFFRLENDPDARAQDFGDAAQGGKRMTFVTG